MEAALVKPVFVARQPIFDINKGVHAYELLFRSGLENHYRSTNPDASTLGVISSMFVEIGLDELTGGRPAFINFTRNLLLEDVARLLSPDLVTIEILEDVAADEEVLQACRKLKDSGFRLALDDFVLAHSGNPLLDVADIVKVDFAGTMPEDRRRIVEDLASRRIVPLAEKVETQEEFAEAAQAGFTYFQGYFFSKPSIRQGKALMSTKLAHLRMMEQLNRPEISIDELERIVKQDVPLSYKLLRFISSAWFGLRHQITSVRHALTWLGSREIRKWYYLVCLRDMGCDKPGELLVRALTRARMAEALAQHVGMPRQAQELFLAGMFSLVDVLLDTPMPELVDRLPLSQEIKSALVGQPSPMRQVLDLLTAYERADWDAFAAQAASLRLNADLVPDIFRKSLKWATEAYRNIE
jgi:EAL and modified HD-GYP domain-containing signal transduction protein